nr:uncharacterized protein LOC112211572 [Halyomorpha halys]
MSIVNINECKKITKWFLQYSSTPIGRIQVEECSRKVASAFSLWRVPCAYSFNMPEPTFVRRYCLLLQRARGFDLHAEPPAISRPDSGSIGQPGTAGARQPPRGHWKKGCLCA